MAFGYEYWMASQESASWNTLRSTLKMLDSLGQSLAFT
jgi:hypothetical protein